VTLATSLLLLVMMLIALGASTLRPSWNCRPARIASAVWAVIFLAGAF
jgi:hypothetical protein